MSDEKDTLTIVDSNGNPFAIEMPETPPLQVLMESFSKVEDITELQTNNAINNNDDQ